MDRASKRKMTKQQMIIVIVVVAVFAAAAAILLIGKPVVAHESGRTPYYRSITVEKGDSLWSIAEEYAAAADNKSLSAYVEELRSINSLRRDAPLQIGQSLLVVYYRSASE